MILNIPMTFLEEKINGWGKLKKGVRPLAIFLSVLFVLGIFVGVALLVVPKLLQAVKLVGQILGAGGRIPIDMETWIENLMTQTLDMTGSLVETGILLLAGFVFSIYLLAGKERLKSQVCRLIRVWLPQKPGEWLIRVSTVSSRIFRLFIAGQTIEAIILGSLCMVGMILLQIPYAAVIGALVGVTALLPVVGGVVGMGVGAILVLSVDSVKAVVFAVFLLILQQVEGNLIYPRVVGAKIKLPAIWVLAAVAVGGNLGGPLGMLLGVPAASAVYTLVREATEKRERLLVGVRKKER